VAVSIEEEEEGGLGLERCILDSKLLALEVFKGD